jgi:excinuclease ABC subunit B
MRSFNLVAGYRPRGDQTAAITQLACGLQEKHPHQVLKGVTGSGKTFTIANIIAQADTPVLVISHNKTLAAQLYQEFKRFFPENAVEYFVSYYDYYQPEAFIPASNTYIAKEATINDEIDRLRLRATNALLHRRDIIIVASVSCIYSIGSPETYRRMSFSLRRGQPLKRKELLSRFTELQYERGETGFRRNTFRVRGDVVELYPSYEDSAIRVRLEHGRVEELHLIDPLLGTILAELQELMVYPKSFFATPKEILDSAAEEIEKELDERVPQLRREGKIVEANRLEERTLFDLEMLREFGWCPGIENYSLYLSERSPGQPPFTLLDYFPPGFLTIIDESHVTVPQIGGMYHGDRSRKQTLVQHGFRLPSAMDNRPLNFAEFEERVGLVLHVSATPGRYELEKAGSQVAEQVIRPTGLTDPELEVRPTRGQVDDLRSEMEANAARGQRTLVTTLTKRMAENLTNHYHDLGLKVRYLHSDIDTLDRVKILRDLRKGVFDTLIGINLLREGLDLPEVSLVAILDADKEGFLRSATSLIQTFGRAARHVEGRAILYADKVTDSMRTAIDETERRRRIQQQYNQKHNITPTSIQKNIADVMDSIYEREYFDYTRMAEDKEIYFSPQKRKQRMEELQRLMDEAAERLEFEKAAQYRDELKKLKRHDLEIGEDTAKD